MKLKLTDLPVVYINLDEQTDRKETLEKNLKDLGFKNIIRVSGFKDPDPNRGCAYSHALGLEEVDPPFILLEDDCMPLNFIDEIEQINEINIVCRAFKEPAALLKTLENKISKENKIILMVSEKKTLSAPGFDIVYKESEASKILGKKRGFLEIQMS